MPLSLPLGGIYQVLRKLSDDDHDYDWLPEVFKVTVTYASDTYSINTTYSDISDAISADGIIEVIYDDYIFQYIGTFPTVVNNAFLSEHVFICQSEGLTQKITVVSNDAVTYSQSTYGTYSKPQNGIPKTDLESTVQTSLGKADTALQPGDVAEPFFVTYSTSDMTTWTCDKTFAQITAAIAAGTQVVMLLSVVGTPFGQASSFLNFPTIIQAWVRIGSNKRYQISHLDDNSVSVDEFTEDAQWIGAVSYNQGISHAGEFLVVGSDGNVTISLKDGNSVTIEDAEGKTVQFANKYTTNGPIDVQFANDSLTVNDEADFYWAGGSDATVSIADANYSGDNLNADLSNERFNNHDVLGFYGDIKELDATGWTKDATLTGNKGDNVIKAGSGDTSLTGGKGDDTLIGGAGEDTFSFNVEDGNDLIQGFDPEKDFITANDALIATVAVVNDDDVVLTLKEHATSTADGQVTIEGVAGDSFLFENKFTDGPINMKVDEGTMAVDDKATFYWAAGENATLTMADFTADSVDVNLKNSNFKDTDRLSFFGDIQGLDATGYKGEINITGKAKKDNILVGGDTSSTLWGGGASNDTLIGGAGEDEFIYKAGDGNDVIKNATSNDTIKFEGITLADLKATGEALFSGNDIVFELKDEVGGGSLTIENGHSNGGATVELGGKSYYVDGDGKWQFKK